MSDSVVFSYHCNTLQIVFDGCKDIFQGFLDLCNVVWQSSFEVKMPLCSFNADFAIVLKHEGVPVAAYVLYIEDDGLQREGITFGNGFGGCEYPYPCDYFEDYPDRPPDISLSVPVNNQECTDQDGDVYAHLAWLGTHIDHRGRGYATLCINDAKRLAKSEGATILSLYCSEKNTDLLVKLYERNGFTHSPKEDSLGNMRQRFIIRL